MANFSFTNGGALPNSASTPVSSVKSPFVPQSPVASALNFAQSSTFKPAGAVKKTVTTDSAGNTQETHYDTSGNSTPPAGNTTGVLSSAPVNNDGSAASQNNPNYGFQTQGLVNGSSPSSSNSGTPTPQPAPAPAAPFSQATAGLLNVGNNGSAGYDTAVQNLANFNRDLAQKTGAIESQPIPLKFVQGREQVLNRQAATEQAALQGAVTQEQTQENQQIGALSSAGSLTAPRQNGYVLIDPATGQPVGGNGTSAVTQGAQTDAQYQGALANATDNQAITGAQSNIDSITQLINKGNLNPNTVNLGNATVQQIQNNLSSSDYATLTNSLGAINAALTKVTGSPVDIAQLSTQNGTSLLTTINNEVAVAKAIAAGKLNSGSQANAQPSTASSNSASTPNPWH